MKIDINVASVIGSAFMLMLGVIGFFLSRIAKRLDEMEKRGEKTTNDVTRIDGDLKTIDTELKAIMKDQEETNKKLEKQDDTIIAFLQNFTPNIRQALAPQFDALERRLERLEDNAMGK